MSNLALNKPASPKSFAIFISTNRFEKIKPIVAEGSYTTKRLNIFEKLAINKSPNFQTALFFTGDFLGIDNSSKNFVQDKLKRSILEKVIIPAPLEHFLKIEVENSDKYHELIDFIKLSHTGNLKKIDSTQLDNEMKHTTNLANKALQDSYQEAQKQGLSIRTVRNNQIVEEHPDGSVTVIENLAPKSKVLSRKLTLS